MESRWVEVGGLSMHARVATAAGPAAPRVVLVHGIGVASRYFVPLAEQLASQTQVYAPDLPGFGESGKPGRVLDIVELADALAAWMDAVGLERATMLGNSVGCQIVAHFAVRHPTRVERLVLAGPTFDPRARTAMWAVLRWLQNNRHERLAQIPHQPPRLPRRRLEAPCRHLSAFLAGPDRRATAAYPGACARRAR